MSNVGSHLAEDPASVTRLSKRKFLNFDGFLSDLNLSLLKILRVSKLIKICREPCCAIVNNMNDFFPKLSGHTGPFRETSRT
jgi:hypothetical protein